LSDLQILVDGSLVNVHIKHFGNRRVIFSVEGQHHEAALHHLEDGQMNLMLDENAHTLFISENKDKSALVSLDGHFFHVQRNDLLGSNDKAPEEMQASDEKKSAITAPMPGTVIKININEGDKVKKGDVLLIVESMKMENNILAAAEGIVKKLNVSPKDMVEKNTVLVVLESE